MIAIRINAERWESMYARTEPTWSQNRRWSESGRQQTDKHHERIRRLRGSAGDIFRGNPYDGWSSSWSHGTLCYVPDRLCESKHLYSLVDCVTALLHSRTIFFALCKNLFRSIVHWSDPELISMQFSRFGILQPNYILRLYLNLFGEFLLRICQSYSILGRYWNGLLMKKVIVMKRIKPASSWWYLFLSDTNAKPCLWETACRDEHISIVTHHCPRGRHLSTSSWRAGDGPRSGSRTCLVLLVLRKAQGRIHFIFCSNEYSWLCVPWYE